MSVTITDTEIERLIHDLGSASYQTREQANERLRRVRRVAVNQLTAAIDTAPTLEIELRLKKLLSKNVVAARVTAAEYRQLCRMIHLLELFGGSSTPGIGSEARDLLMRLAETHIDNRVSNVAAKAISRMRTLRSGPGV